jgi:hypothetical protein
MYLDRWYSHGWGCLEASYWWLRQPNHHYDFNYDFNYNFNYNFDYDHDDNHGCAV